MTLIDQSEIKHRMNIKPVNKIEQVLYLLLIQGTVTSTEIKSIVESKSAKNFYYRLTLDHGICINKYRCSTYVSYELVDYFKAAQVYESMITNRFIMEQRHKEIISLHKEFPCLSYIEIGRMLGTTLGVVWYALNQN